MTSVNYYHYQKDLNRTLAIGNSTTGWAFSLVTNVYASLLHWKEAWKLPNSYITLDFVKRIDPEEMETIITFRKGNSSSLMIALSNSDSFHGPHDLACQKIGSIIYGYKCVANEGCWDLVVQE